MAHLVYVKDRAPKGYLSVTLMDVLSLVQPWARTLRWSLLYLYGTGDLGNGCTMGDFERKVRDASYGLDFSWSGLLDLAKKLWDVYHIMLVGANQPPYVKRTDEDLRIFAESGMFIELVDSNFWRIYAREEAVIDRVMSTFKDVEIQDHLLEVQPGEASDL